MRTICQPVMSATKRAAVKEEITDSVTQTENFLFVL